MTIFDEARIKLTNTQLNKLISGKKIKQGRH